MVTPVWVDPHAVEAIANMRPADKTRLRRRFMRTMLAQQTAGINGSDGPNIRESEV